VEFENFIKNYDIVLLCETKLCDTFSDSIQIPGYQLIPRNRKGSKIASGGVAALIKEDICENFQPVQGNCDFALWLMGKMAGNDVLVGVVYIPPANTDYSDITMFDDLENDIILLTSGKECSTLLFGDFNSRTANHTDCLLLDDAISEALDFSEEIRRDLFNEEEMYSNGINPVRHSLDSSSDKYGDRLLELCKALGLYILNGRVGSDKGIGQTTCKDSSLVDYVIGSAELVQHVNSFKVLPFDPMLSDCHNPVHITFKNQNRPRPNKNNEFNPPSETPYSIAPRKPKWNPKAKHSFVDYIERSKITDLMTKLSLLESSVGNVTTEAIDKIVQDICSTFSNSAAKCEFITQPPGKLNQKSAQRPYKRQLPRKPWFNNSCEQKRRIYHEAK
jgi:hypothetical protein